MSNVMERVQKIREEKASKERDIERLRGGLQQLMEVNNEQREKLEEKGIKFNSLDDLGGLLKNAENRVEGLLNRYEQQLGLNEEE